MIPAIEGVEAEVPPTTAACSRTVCPFCTVHWQEPSMQTRYPSWPPAAASATSGRSRVPSARTPCPACHEGFGYPEMQVIRFPEIVESVQLLDPPLPDHSR